jgi:hypothetical protein
MLLDRRPLLSRILVLLALFQLVAPSVAAIADAWRLDRREAYAHIESESTSSCAVVHAHDCSLCSVATHVGSGHRPSPLMVSTVVVHALGDSHHTAPIHRVTDLGVAPRAPPTTEG